MCLLNTPSFSKLIKLHTSKGKRTAREPCIITHSPPFISCAEYNYHLIIGGPIFPRLNRKSIRCARGSACQSVKLEEAEFGGVREKLDAVHCETQLTQEFTVGLIKQMKSRTQKQQAQSSKVKHWEEERRAAVKSSEWIGRQQAEELRT